MDASSTAHAAQAAQATLAAASAAPHAAASAFDSNLVRTLVLLAAGVVAVPLFKRLGLGSVLGYLAAGLLVGPFGLGVFHDAHAVVHFAELGVVMFLFVIGLEMQPSRLWAMRRDIFGLGALQVAVCGGALTVLGMVGYGLGFAAAFVTGMGFVLSSTAIVMQLMEERGDVARPPGQKIVAILLLEDLAIVPLLALVAVLAPAAAGAPPASTSAQLAKGLAAVAAIVALVAVSRWLLNPMFRVLANAKAREVMTAAALLVVLGAATAMEAVGLSMAMGAFAAGVMLSESSFRHQLEADIEPFRGLLLGLFFIGVGMTLDVNLVRENWRTLIAATVAYMAVKALGVYAVARIAKANRRTALERAALMAQGGEFAFVLYGAAAQAGILPARLNAALTAAIIVSMALTPLLMKAVARFAPKAGGVDLDGVDAAHDLHAQVLQIGFGRFGQIVSQALVMRGLSVSVIESDTDMIRAAARFGARVYYGDGRRLDVLRASGAEEAGAILVCVDDKAAATQILEQVREAFPRVPVLVRAYDRQHAAALEKHGAAFQVRETFESALVFGRAALRTVGIDADEAQSVVDRVRELDAERFANEVLSGFSAERVRDHLGTLQAKWQQTPLVRPAHEADAGNAQAEAALRGSPGEAGRPLSP